MSGYQLSHLLASAAERFPERPAVQDPKAMLSYAELEEQANRLAHVLREAGVARGDRVGLLLTKSVSAVVGLYGILKTGAAYVPLDPFAPAARLAYIASNCEIRCLVTGAEKAAIWPELLDAGAPVHTLVVPGLQTRDAIPFPPAIRLLGQDALDAAPTTAPDNTGIDMDLAYILYTSGSTGQPKGVMLSHLNALTYVRWCHQYFGGTSEDVFSNHAPLHFDLTILDIFAAAMAAARLVVVPPEISVFPSQLAGFIERHGITVWYSVPSVLSMLVVHGGLTTGRLPSIRHMIFAGEVFPTKHLRELMRLVPHANFTNLYGPTETNVCTYYAVPPIPDGQVDPIPIGRAIDDVEVLALTEDGRRAEQGEVGELYVRGTTVAYGYWADPERTARGFLANPLAPTQDRVYRTGDLVRQDADGNYFFLGRRDHQIKSRGYRIELGEIEAALYAHPAVAECAATPVPDELIGARIEAHVVLRDESVTEADLVRCCAQRLPKYMIPEMFVIRQELPKTSTGKIDRSALMMAPTAGRR